MEFVRQSLTKKFFNASKNVMKSSKWVSGSLKTLFRRLIDVEMTFCVYWDYACLAETSMTFLGFAI